MLGIAVADEPEIFEVLNGDPPPPLPMRYEWVDPHLAELGVKVPHGHYGHLIRQLA